MRSTVRRWSLGLIPGLFMLSIAVPALAKPDKAWLGVTTQRVTEELRDALDLKGDGVLVNRVVLNGPADRAGIRNGDVITTVNGRAVDSPAELAEAVQNLSVGSSARVRVLRRNGAQTLSVRLGERPTTLDDGDWETPTPSAGGDRGERRTRAFRNGKEIDPDDMDFEFDGKGMAGQQGLRDMPGMMSALNRPRLGVRVEKMNPDLGGYFGGTNGRGALVVEVIEDTPAERAGIKAGDVITAVGSTNVDDADDLIQAIAGDEGSVSLTVVRRGVRRTIVADLGDAPRNSMTWRMRDGRAPRAPRAPMAPGAPGTMRLIPDHENEDASELRREVKELREQLDEMKRQLEDRDR
ncbi:MAG: PDZ domain-containing protein [Candidatus Eisenbacteria bacterium]